MVTIRRVADIFTLATDIAAGDTVIHLDGDQSSSELLQPGKEIVIGAGATWEHVTVSNIAYNTTYSYTDVTLQSAVANNYSAGDNVYGLRTVKTEVGKLVGDGATVSFPVEQEPNEVRIFTDGAPWGVALTYADPPGADQWRYNPNTQQVELGFTPMAGDIVVAYAGEDAVFAGKYLAEGLYTEIEDILFMTPDVAYDCIYVGRSIYKAADVDAEWIDIGKEIAPGTWEWYNYHTFCGVAIGEWVRFKIKATLQGPAQIFNYYNVALYTGHILIPTN